MTELIRTKTKGCYIQKQTQCGTAFVPVDDPLAQDPEPDVDSFTLSPNFPKLPENIVTAIYRLFYDTAKVASTEVTVLLLRSVEDPSIWKCLIPKQTVGPTSVKADFSITRDIFTAEEFSQFPPPGWFHAGSSHSHVNMSAFFSSTDDASELKVPGLHIVWGKVTQKKVEILPSIVYRRKRYLINDFSKVMEVDLVKSYSTYNPKVKELVELKPLPVYVNKFAIPAKDAVKVPKGKGKNEKGDGSLLRNYDPAFDYGNDPFFWQGHGVPPQEKDLEDLSDKELLESLEEVLITIAFRQQRGVNLHESVYCLIAEYFHGD